ncbi:MAG TPA: S24 family peptidase [Treponemataceae bacterium]|nr:S24 family peptidase [Treponemataceae bacterium]
METLTDEVSVAGRFAQVRLQAGLTKKAFAETLGIHPVVSGDIELGKRDPSRDVLVRLARTYDVDINWLLTGKSARDGFTGSGANGSDDRDSDVVEIEFVRQEAAAGRGVEIEEGAESVRLPVLRSFIAPRRPDRVRAVEVRGDSMTGIGLDDRDIVFFAPDERSGDGIHVISIATQLLVKRVLFDPAGQNVHVISENPAYPVRLLSGPDLETFRIEGRVIGWMHRS